MIKIIVNEIGEKAYVEVIGSIDDLGAEELKSVLTGLNFNLLKEIIFDFSNVTFVGSRGIGKLLTLYKEISPGGGKIYLNNLQRDIYHMLKMTKLDKIFCMTAKI